MFLICALINLAGGLATIVFAAGDQTKSWATPETAEFTVSTIINETETATTAGSSSL